MKKYNSFLGAFFSGDNGQGGYNAAYKKSALASLYNEQLAPEQQNQVAANLSRVDPEAANKWQEDIVKQSASLLVTLGKDNPLAVQAWQTRIKPNLSRIYGAQADALPDIPDDNAFAIARQIAGVDANQDAMPADIRTNQWYLKQLGYKPGSKEEQDFLRMRAGQIPKAVPYGFKYDEQGNVWVEDKNQGEIRPGQFGGQTPPPQAGGVAIGNPVSVQTDNEAPVDFSTLPADEQRALTLASQAAAQGKPFHYTVKGGVVAPAAPQQAKIGVKPEAPKPTYRPATPQEKAAYGIAADVPARIDSTGKVEPITVPKTGMEKTPAQIEAEQRQKTARVEMSRVLKLMLDEYKTLNETKGITSTERGVLDNIGAYARASDTGQVIGRITGTADQSARDTINQLKPQVLSAVMAASGMSAKQLDSNAEMKLWLSAVTDPQTSYQTVIKVTDNLLKKFTGQGIEQFESGGSKPPAQPPAGKRVGRFVIEEN